MRMNERMSLSVFGVDMATLVFQITVEELYFHEQVKHLLANTFVIETFNGILSLS